MLTRIGAALLRAAGASAEEAERSRPAASTPISPATTSHGVIMVPTYIERIKVGHIVPGAPWTIVQESPTTTVIDGHWGFGYVVNERGDAR